MRIEEFELLPEVENFLTTFKLLYDEEFQTAISFQFFDDVNKFKTLNFGGEKYLSLGLAEGGRLCLQISTGEIFNIYNENALPKCFVNSSLQRLLIFAEAYAEIWRNDENSGDDVIFDAVKNGKRIMKQTDVEALQPGSFWSEVVREQEMIFLPVGV